MNSKHGTRSENRQKGGETSRLSAAMKMKGSYTYNVLSSWHTGSSIYSHVSLRPATHISHKAPHLNNYFFIHLCYSTVQITHLFK